MNNSKPSRDAWPSGEIDPEVRERVTACFQSVEKRISLACQKSGRPRDSVHLISVTKKRSLEEVRVLWELGVRNMGENRVQDARKRIPVCPEDIHWHYIGPIQTNKVKYFPGIFKSIHSVYRIEEVQSIHDQYNKKQEVKPGYFLQVNVSGEETKQGIELMDVEPFLKEVVEKELDFPIGFMTMAPYDAESDVLRNVFQTLSRIRKYTEEKTKQKIPYLSMGMSNDFDLAIEEGATHIRVGTSLFEPES